MLQASAYCATSRSVLRSPLPPMRIRGRGVLTGMRAAQRLRELVVPALVRAVVVAPHLQADLDRLLEPLEALGRRRERHAEAAVLALVPRRADAELGPAARHDVERRHRLGQQPGMAVGHAGDEQAQPQPLGAAGDEAERGVALEHRVLGRRHPVHLEEVVHERQRADADGLGPLRRGRRRRARCRPGRRPSRSARRGDRVACPLFYLPDAQDGRSRWSIWIALVRQILSTCSWVRSFMISSATFLVCGHVESLCG